MHVYTLVITRGPRRSAVRRAGELLAQAVPRHFDSWQLGGAFADRLGSAPRPEIDAWYAAEDERRKDFEAEHSLISVSDVEYDLRELQWGDQEEPERRRRRRLEEEEAALPTSFA